jgi:glycosyltransferase involved in cell wall biosynthesis
VPGELRILHLLSGREAGGITRVVATVTAGPALPGVEPFIGILSDAGRELADGPGVVQLGRRGLLDLRAVLRLLAFVRRERIGILHTHNVTANIYGALVGLLMPRLVHVVHVHAHIHHVLLGTRISALKRSLLLRGNVWALHWCDRIIAVSESVRDLLIELRTQPRKIDVIHNAVDVPALEREAQVPCAAAEGLARARAGERSDGANLVGAVGRLVPEKNYPLFLEMARLVLDQEPATFVIVGDGPERQRLQDMATTMGIAAHVRFLGWLANPYPALAAMDVVTSTSSTEGFALSVLEAMALGKPVVATAVGAVPEIIRDQVTGVLVPDGDAVAFAVEVVRLLRDPVRRHRLGARGKEVACSEFSAIVLRDRLGQVYRSAVRERRPGHGEPGTADEGAS